MLHPYKLMRKKKIFFNIFFYLNEIIKFFALRACQTILFQTLNVISMPAIKFSAQFQIFFSRRANRTKKIIFLGHIRNFYKFMVNLFPEIRLVINKNSRSIFIELKQIFKKHAHIYPTTLTIELSWMMNLT